MSNERKLKAIWSTESSEDLHKLMAPDVAPETLEGLPERHIYDLYLQEKESFQPLDNLSDDEKYRVGLGLTEQLMEEDPGFKKMVEEISEAVKQEINLEFLNKEK